MDNNLLNETFNKHLNLLRNRLKLNESEDVSSWTPWRRKKHFAAELSKKIGEYAKELLAEKPFYYQNPDGRYQLIDKIKSHKDFFYLEDKELMKILNDVLKDDEQWVTAKNKYHVSAWSHDWTQWGYRNDDSLARMKRGRLE